MFTRVACVSMRLGPRAALLPVLTKFDDADKPFANISQYFGIFRSWWNRYSSRVSFLSTTDE